MHHPWFFQIGVIFCFFLADNELLYPLQFADIFVGLCNGLLFGLLGGILDSNMPVPANNCGIHKRFGHIACTQYVLIKQFSYFRSCYIAEAVVK